MVQMPHEHTCLYNAITLFLNNNCPMKANYHEMNVRDLTNTPKGPSQHVTA